MQDCFCAFEHHNRLSSSFLKGTFCVCLTKSTDKVRRRESGVPGVLDSFELLFDNRVSHFVESSLLLSSTAATYTNHLSVPVS